MKIKYYLLIIMLSFGSNFLFAQHENDNWVFGNNKWKFDNSSPNGFTHTTNLSSNIGMQGSIIRYVSSVISDKNTGDLLFYSDGYKIYNKNGAIMTNGDNLFTPTPVYQYDYFGNPSDQSSIIVPVPNSRSLYYVFYINGNRRMSDQVFFTAPSPTNYGLRYAIVDMSLSGGLGSVTSKNNVLFSNSETNALTSTITNDGNSYWIVTANNGNFLSYKLNASGLNTTPVVSSGANYGTFIKISPNSQKLLTRQNKSVWLYNFNNNTGSVTNPFNITPNNNVAAYYNDNSQGPNSAEFSPDSNIVYFISSQANQCTYPSCPYNISWSGLSMYNINTNSLIGLVNTAPTYQFSLNGIVAGMQLAKNGKIYLLYNAVLNDTNGYGYKEVIFGNTNTSTGAYISYDWGVINNPNIWSPTVNPLSTITPQNGTRNGFSFPQLIPTLNPCPDNQNIDYPVTASQNFQAGQSITASSIIDDGLTVNYKAGNNVTLLPGFHVKATENSLFHAYIGPCDGIIANFARNSNTSVNSIFKETKEQISDLKISPNPASIFININSGNEKITSWELFDISGKSVLKGSSTQVNVQGLPKAAYLLKININNKITTKKVIVK
ncbi:T9SS type A sorting domain-containing protein [Chryseobacterium schmidteae]|uniref:T9SS type A sorting domain-containing protein n=1 Tax=Chryseobacterium schmidteae TaxID=2730404 RepID=UPI00158A20AD|nr:T9SS type A sorting domain-containing protein [Chryseobacterium schmidteae]